MGRRDRLEAEGTIDSLVESLAKFSQKYRALKALSLKARTAKLWGPALIFGRRWQERGLPEILGRLVDGRKFGFDLERVAFAMTLQRLIVPGSDLQGCGWAQSVEGLPEIALQHLYWAKAFLAEDREELEKALFVRDQDLFSQELDVVFLDTTSVAIHRAEETEWRKRSYSRYLRVTKDAIRIDEDKVLAESRYDGKYVLLTNTDLPATEVAQTYKSLWRVERAFRETKSTIEVRPVFHHRDETMIGHIVAGFLTLRLEMDLQRWPDERKVEVS